MSELFILIRPNWRRSNREIWKSLEKKVSTPKDMYIELLRFASHKLGIELDVEAINNAEIARDRFIKFPVPKDELSCISILEGFYDVLSDFGTDVAEQYRHKLDRFLTEHNLRYYLTTESRLKLSLEGLLMTYYAMLRKSVSNRRERIDSLNELQTSISHLHEIDGERNSIRIASNLLEGLAIDKSKRLVNTLSAAIDCCPGLFPHNSLKECVKNLYKFWSDYPNIRHAGTPASRVRDLRKDDAFLIISLTLGMASFLSDDSAGNSVLNGEIAGSSHVGAKHKAQLT